jgi:hypothetical protein
MRHGRTVPSPIRFATGIAPVVLGTAAARSLERYVVVVGVLTVVTVAPGGNANNDGEGDVEKFVISKLVGSDATLT